MKKSDIDKNYYSNLICRVYVLGASLEGESILFIIYGDGKVIYSCITDSFIFNGVNVPMFIAEECNLDHVTDIFWTHPHDDHSEGLVELIEKYKPEYVYIPADLQALPETVSEISRKVLEKINQYQSCDGRFSYQPCIVDIGINYNILEKRLNVAGKKIPFEIYAVAPMIGKVRRNIISDNFNRLNDFSIALYIVIGDFSILLTGDIQDQMIKYVFNDLQRDIITPNVLKIPHHGSKGSLNIMSLFKDDYFVDVAVSTAKYTSGLPRKEALEFYSKYCNKLYKIEGCDNIVAVWGIEVDILEATITELELQNYNDYCESGF